MSSDEDADFREFVRAQSTALRGLAYLTCGDWQLAEDAVCTALAKLYRRWKKIANPYGYVRTMVVRAAIDEVRRPWWRREDPGGDAMPEPPAVDGTGSVVDRVVIAAALRRLPAGPRAVLVLRYLEGLTVRETAETLGMPEGTVTSHATRGLAALRPLLSTEAPRVVAITTRGKRIATPTESIGVLRESRA